MTLNPELEFQDSQARLKQGMGLIGIWLDEDIIIDILLNNPCSYLEDCVQLLALIKSRKINGFITCKGLIDIYNFINKTKGELQANEITSILLEYLKIRTSGLEDYREKCQDKSGKNRIFFFSDLDEDLNQLIDEEVELIVSQNRNAFLNKYHLILPKINYQNLIIVNPSDFLDWFDLEGEKESLRDYVVNKKNHKSLIETIGQEYNLDRLECLEKELGRVNDNLTDEQIPIAENLYLKNFEVHCCQNHYAKAKVTLHSTKLDKQQSEDAYGNGAIDALCRAFDEAINSLTKLSSYVLKSISSHNLEQGLESRVSATAILMYDGEFYEGTMIHTDTVKAAFYAYIRAVNKIFKHEVVSSHQVSHTVVATMTQYAHGKRDFSGINLSKKLINKVNWSEINLSYANLSHTHINWAKLRKSNLYKAKLEGISLHSSNLSNANLEEANLCGAKIEESYLNNANLFSAKMNNLTMYKVTLHGAKLGKANLSGANLTEANFSEVNLDNANLEKANLTMANLNKATLHTAICSEAIFNRAILNSANLTGANLTGANLTGADLTGADLTGVDLTGANLTGADLTGANLTGANLTGANLTRANLTGVDLSKTRLDNTNLSQANLSTVNLKGLNLDTTLLCRAFLNGAIMPDGKVHKGYTSLDFEMREVRYHLPTPLR